MSSKDVIQQRQVQVTFISELQVKTLTPMSANKVTTSLINFILLSQDLHITKILGQTLYDNLMAEWIVAAYDVNRLPKGDGVIPPIILNDTTNYYQLYQEIYKPLVWWTYVLSLPNIAIKVEESGVMLNSTDYSDSAGIVGLDRLVAEGQVIARAYTEQLREYICETFKNDSTVNSESKNVGGVSIGIFVPKRPWSNHKRCTNC